jgi:hypothetical protein
MASSAESAGGLRFGKTTEVVIESDFRGAVGEKAAGPSGYHSDFVVKPSTAPAADVGVRTTI